MGRGSSSSGLLKHCGTNGTHRKFLPYAELRGWLRRQPNTCVITITITITIAELRSGDQGGPYPGTDGGAQSLHAEGVWKIQNYHP